MGYDTYAKTYEDIVDEMIYEIMELRQKVVETEYQRFEKEMNRIKRPTN